MSFTRNWSDGTPLGTEQASDLDTFIQNVRGDISDRIKNMVYGFVAGENTLSQHFQYLQFYEQASVAQPSAGYGRVYCKAVDGKCELFWQDEDGDEIQLTTGGTLGGPNINLLAGMDLLGSATSDITINTNKFTVAGATGNTLVAGTLDVTGVATVGDASLLKTSAAPTTDAMIANKKYVDDQIVAKGVGGTKSTLGSGKLTTSYVEATDLTFSGTFSTAKDLMVIISGGYNIDNQTAIFIKASDGTYTKEWTWGGAIDDSNNAIPDIFGFSQSVLIPKASLTGASQTFTVSWKAGSTVNHGCRFGRCSLMYLQVP